ncbi:hypothetical protein SDC9_178010 [bioreactor metagenome]|uniref:Uncharacterized protein n=1 Tax=bioreactor metagenome TaxID=1076179 RepID=A0A645GXQ9_9ZZZZ
MTIIDLTDAQYQQFADATKDVYKQFEKEVGQEAIDMYLKCLAEAKK